MKRLLSLLIVLTLVLGLALGASAEGKATEIEFWNGFTGSDGKQMEVIVEAFNNTHPDIHVTMQLIPWGEYWEKITAGAQSGVVPNVGVIHFDDIPKFAALGVALPMDDMVASDLNVGEDDYPEGYWEASKFNGQIYGIPYDFHPVVMFYNKDLLEAKGVEIPKTGEEFIAACQALTDPETETWGTAIPVADNGFMRMVFMRTLLYQFGGVEFNDDGKTYAFNSEAGQKALQWMVDLIYKYQVAPENCDNSWDLFTSGKVGLYFNGPWNILGFNENTDLHYGTAEMPVVGDSQVVWAGSHQLALLNKKDKTPEEDAAAAVFIKYLIDNSVEWAKAGQVPALNSARESDAVQNDPLLKPIAAEFDYMKLAQPSPWYSDGYAYIFSDELTPALQNQLSVQEALDNSVAYCDEMTAELVAKFGE